MVAGQTIKFQSLCIQRDLENHFLLGRTSSEKASFFSGNQSVSIHLGRVDADVDGGAVGLLPLDALDVNAELLAVTLDDLADLWRNSNKLMKKSTWEMKSFDRKVRFFQSAVEKLSSLFIQKQNWYMGIIIFLFQTRRGEIKRGLVFTCCPL